jgi:hypothetical protein
MVEWYWQGKTEVLGKNILSQCHFVHHKSYMYLPCYIDPLLAWWEVRESPPDPCHSFFEFSYAVHKSCHIFSPQLAVVASTRCYWEAHVTGYNFNARFWCRNFVTLEITRMLIHVTAALPSFTRESSVGMFHQRRFIVLNRLSRFVKALLLVLASGASTVHCASPRIHPTFPSQCH